MSFLSFLQKSGSGKTKFLLVEVEKPRPSLPGMDKEVAQSIQTLQGHPGFQYLLAKLRLQESLLRSTLSTQRQKSLTDVEFLQSGIAWCGWLEDQLQRAVNFKAPKAPIEPLEAERMAFEEVARQIQVLE